MLTVLAIAVCSQSANPYLEQARALALELKFSEAITQLQVAKQVPNLDAAQRAEILELLARCSVAEGNRALAESAFEELLALEPERELDRESTSPKILEVFDAVKKHLFPNRSVSFVELAAPAGRVRLRVIDPYHRVAEAALFFRNGDEAWRSTILAVRDGEVDFPAPPVPSSGTTAWYVVALDDSGARLGSWGSDAEPRLVEFTPRSPVATTQPSAVRGTTTAGIVVASLAVAATVTASILQLNSQALDRASRDPTMPPGDWADTARDAHSRAVSLAISAMVFFSVAGVAGVTSAVLFWW